MIVISTGSHFRETLAMHKKATSNFAVKSSTHCTVDSDCHDHIITTLISSDDHHVDVDQKHCCCKVSFPHHCCVLLQDTEIVLYWSIDLMLNKANVNRISTWCKIILDIYSFVMTFERAGTLISARYYCLGFF